MEERYGRLVVLKVPMARSKQKHKMVRVRCDCGEFRTVALAYLKSGHTKSCGCLRVKLARERATTHGGCGTRLYKTWADINARCNNPNHKDYKYYGGRSIKNKFKSFEEFREFAAYSGYRDGLTIDRIDNNSGYEPDNCRWATPTEQNRNRRDNLFIAHPVTGERLCATDWSRRLGGESHLVSTRIHKLGWSPEKAILTPVKGERYE